MRNDYKRINFWEKKAEGNTIEYFFKCKNEYIKLDKEVFFVLKRSYLKILNDQARDFRNIELTSSVENKMKNQIILINNIDNIMQKEMEQKLESLVAMLPLQERYTIRAIYYNDKTESQIAKELHVTKSSVHRRKVSALKKLKKLLTEAEPK